MVNLLKHYESVPQSNNPALLGEISENHLEVYSPS